MTTARELAASLKEVATRLKTAAVWNGTGLAVDAKTDDYVYELLCYFKAATAATAGFRLEIAGAVDKAKSGKVAARWPRKPGLKANFSYIRLLNGQQEEFQLCPGIRVTDIHGKDRAPDISLQVAGAPAKPTHSHLVGVWDAKHTANEGSRVPDVAVADFAYTFQQLGNPVPPSTWLSAVKPKEWRCSGVLTNGNESTELTAALAASGISETCRYPSAMAATRP
jgi:hypothetical protein